MSTDDKKDEEKQTLDAHAPRLEGAETAEAPSADEPEGGQGADGGGILGPPK